jgi:hypothetical protein
MKQKEQPRRSIIVINQELRKRLAVYCTANDVTIKSVSEEAITQFLKSKGASCE